jgi:uncharacterized integral membrane protein
VADPTKAEGKNGISGRQWALGVAAVLLVIFIALNSQQVKVHFIVGDTTMALSFALLLATGLGIVIGWVGSRLRRHDREGQD